MRKALTIFLTTALCANGFAQLSTNEQPVSFDDGISLNLDDGQSVPIATMPALDMETIEKEDMADEENGNPPRFGYSHKVNYNLNNSGLWQELPNGDKLWRLNVYCPEALSIHFLYDKFWIPEGGKFFIYSTDHRHYIGAFTNRNNKGDNVNVRGFATELVYGSEVTLEYYQPNYVTEDAIISIDYIVHGYRYIHFGDRWYGDAGDCQVNVNCPEGDNWQNEKKAVARIIINGYGFTGSLINTTDLNQKPYLLTAHHCIEGLGDAITSPNLDYSIFDWNYESPGCSNSLPTHSYSTSGATILANDSLSDFALLQLVEDPKDIIGFVPYYLGWDRTGQSGDPGVCIHHPRRDVKKISTVSAQPTSTEYDSYTVSPNAPYWRVIWKKTQNGHGTTEPGSSGSSLLTGAHKVIGQLTGGKSSCKYKRSPDWFGKISYSWTNNNNSNVHRRLNCWLDSLNTGEQTIEGLLIISADSTMSADLQLYSNIRILSSGQLSIQSDIELIGNSRVIVEPGGALIIDGGTLSNVELVLKPGASLHIINNGILETRNGFTAPVGAVVLIEHGQII